MAWFKIDDGWWSHPKTLQLSDASIALWARAGSWSCQQLTDGRISVEALGMLRGKPKVAEELVRVGYWDSERDGWRFHDWDEYQEHSDVVKKRRSDARERMRTVRANRERTKGERSQEVRSTPTRPDPTRPVKQLPEITQGGTAGGEPPLFCRAHPAGGTKCGACADARRLHQSWEKAEKSKPTALPPRTADTPAHQHRWMPDGTCLHCTERREAS